MTKDLVKKVKVAVYGSLRQGLHNHRLLEGDTYIGQFETEPIYSLIDLGSYPGLLKNGNTPIIMEVYEVDAEKLSRLDSLEGYRGKDVPSNFYNREKIDSPYGRIFVYFYNKNSDYIRSLAIETGDWKDYRETKNIRATIKSI